MNAFIAILLLQDGLTTGAIYVLLALVLVMLFSVTRVIFVPQGELISFAALTLAGMTAGRMPRIVFLVIIALVLVGCIDFYRYLTRGRKRADLRAAMTYFALPLPLLILAYFAPAWPYWLQIIACIAIIAPLGPAIYRLALQPLADASVLLLLIVAVAVHFLLLGAGLLIFGAEGVRTPPLVPGTFLVGPYPISGQAIFVWASAALLLMMAYLFFEFTLWGKALRATAFNRVGARLVGIPSQFAGTAVFFIASLVGAISGILIAPITTIYYDTGFLIGLKGFIAAIVGALVSYPLAAVGALSLGLIETFASFWASVFKDVIIFALIVPVLLWQNFFLSAAHGADEQEEE